MPDMLLRSSARACNNGLGGIDTIEMVTNRHRYSIDLCAHMAECDANYLRLAKLMPNLNDSDGRVFNVTLAAATLVVRFEVRERSRYTTVLEVTQDGGSGGLQSMIMSVRLYHDAKSAEVIAYQNQRGFAAVYDYPNAKMRHRDEKAQVNRLLSEFLSMCLANGVSSEEPTAVFSS